VEIIEHESVFDEVPMVICVDGFYGEYMHDTKHK